MRARWIYVDADAFFASCDVAERGLAPGTPLAVASGGTGGCVIAATYAAKAAGVSRGQRMAQAQAACPGLVVAPQRPPLYVRMHGAMVEAVDTVRPVEHVFSIDEAAVRIGPRDDPEGLVEAVGEAVPAALGEAVQVSVGAAPSLLLAKLAAEGGKPRARCTVEAAPGSLSRYPVGDLAGVGPAVGKRLEAAGIADLGALLAAGPATARAVWGSRAGVDVWMELAGYDLAPHRREARTMSHARVLVGGERGDALAVLRGLAVLLGRRLRAAGAKADRLEGWADAEGFRCSLVPATAGERPLLRALSEAYRATVKPGDKGRIGVLVRIAREEARPAPLPGFAGEEEVSALDRTLDAVRARWGLRSVAFGECRWGQWAGGKIAFHRIPGREGR